MLITFTAEVFNFFQSFNFNLGLRNMIFLNSKWKRKELSSYTNKSAIKHKKNFILTLLY